MRRHLRLSVGTTAIVMMLAACSSEAASDVSIALVEPVPGPGIESDFIATGGAVDDGAVCAQGKGSHVEVEDTETTFVRDFMFTCSDGSGAFSIRVEGVWDDAYETGLLAAVDTGELWEDATWVAVSGSGDYVAVAGDGLRAIQVLEAGVAPWDGGGMQEVFTGDVTR